MGSLPFFVVVFLGSLWVLDGRYCVCGGAGRALRRYGGGGVRVGIAADVSCPFDKEGMRRGGGASEDRETSRSVTSPPPLPHTSPPPPPDTCQSAPGQCGRPRRAPPSRHVLLFRGAGPGSVAPRSTRRFQPPPPAKCVETTGINETRWNIRGCRASPFCFAFFFFPV